MNKPANFDSVEMRTIPESRSTIMVENPTAPVAEGGTNPNLDIKISNIIR